MVRSREEQETIIRFDETDAEAYLWRASPRQVRRWQRAGCKLTGAPGAWCARVPKAAVSGMRRLVAGQVVKRRTGFSLRNARHGVLSMRKSHAPGPEHLERSCSGAML
jgi:hypothetical protein